MTTKAAAQILIVEDERIVAKDLQQTLGKLGYGVRPPVSSAEEAIASAAECCPTLVLMDVRIKGKRDGIETAHILQREFGVPVVYLTAYADDATLERAKPTQPYGYLVKPVRPAELRGVLEMALYRHELDKRSRERERASSMSQPAVGDAVLAVDLAGKVTYLNPTAEQQRAQKQQELGDRLASLQTLASGVAHEVNNSLGPVLTNAEFVLEELRELRASSTLAQASPERLARFDELTRAQSELQSAALRIHAVMADLKAFSRPVEPATGEADVRRALGWAIHASAPELSGRARLTTRIPELPAVRADEAQLGNVLAHLLANAAQAIPLGDPEHNEIRISARADASGGVVIEVHDSGSGMTPEAQQHVFEPFFATNSAGTRRGLGLAICHGLIHSAGGDIQVESIAEGGSTFRIRLLQAVQREPSSLPAPPNSERRIRGRILVVDDNELVRRSVVRILRAHDVVVAENGARALELLSSSTPFDLVLTDVVMPQMDGIELYEALLARDPELARRLVFMSGGTLTARAHDFFRSIRNRCIEKPFTGAQLLDTVQQSLAALVPKTAVS